jgi:hypothetical protein
MTATRTSYPCFIMSTREELKALIDQLPESRIASVKKLLEHSVNPRRPEPEIERMHQRSQEYRRLVEQRFRQTQKPGTLGAMQVGGVSFMHEGVGYADQSFDYWDGKARVIQTLHQFGRCAIEVMQRFSIAEDRKKLSCDVELSSGGRTVSHTEEFPIPT